MHGHLNVKYNIVLYNILKYPSFDFRMPSFLVIVLNMPAMLSSLKSPISDKSCEYFCLLPEALFYTHKQIALFIMKPTYKLYVCFILFLWVCFRTWLYLQKISFSCSWGSGIEFSRKRKLAPVYVIKTCGLSIFNVQNEHFAGESVGWN